MCMMLVGRVRTIDKDAGTAMLEHDTRTWAVSLAPIVLAGGKVVPGDWLLVHSGLAVRIVAEPEALELIGAITDVVSAGGRSP